MNEQAWGLKILDSEEIYGKIFTNVLAETVGTSGECNPTMDSRGSDRDTTNVFGDKTIIHEEEKDEEDMEIEEIIEEPEESEKVTRCKKCRRQKFGHPMPFGLENCQLVRIESDSELKKDDEVKHEKRRELRSRKTPSRKRSLSHGKKVPDPKKKKEEDEEETSDIDEELKEMLEEEKRLEEMAKKSRDDVKKAETQKKEAKKAEQKRKNDELRKTIEGNKEKEAKLQDSSKRNEYPSRRNDNDSRYRQSTSRQDYQTNRNDPYPSRRNDNGGYHPRDYRDWYGEDDRRYINQRNSRREDNYREGSTHSRRSRRSRSRERWKSPSNRYDQRPSEYRDMNLDMVQELRRIGEERQDDRKLDPPPAWEDTISFDAWARSVNIWSEVKAKPQRKAQLLIEMLKKDEKRKGMKEMIVSEVVENREFDYKDENVIENILSKIKDFMEESEWTRNVALAKDFENFCQKDGESNRDYIGRFSNLETKLRNEKAGISNMFLAGWIMNKSKISQAEKNNILANFDTEDKENILKNLKKKIRNMNSSGSHTDPKETLFGNQQNRHHHQFRSRSRSFHRGRPDKSRERSQFSRKFDRSGSRNKTNENYRRNSRSPKNVKKTYTCEKFQVNKAKSIFEEEVENRALVDSGCPEMVCGEEWMKTFEHSTDMKYEEIDLEDHFKFGNEVFKTTTYKKIPLTIGSLEEMVDVGVVTANIPLLISKKKLKDWGARIDFEKNELFIKKTNETVKLNETKSGHLTLNMARTLPENSEEFLKEIFLIKKKKSYRMKELKKVHRVFGHPSIEKMESLLKDAGEDEIVLKIMRKIQENC